jgi:hypothetical protein
MICLQLYELEHVLLIRQLFEPTTQYTHAGADAMYIQYKPE